ncbi:MAG TPA: DUF4013 domain-containing protein [Anaerolineales bacterium]
MQIEKAFRYQFEDAQWITKLGLGALISLVPILNLMVVGYMVGIIRNMATHADQPLPDWDDLGDKFRDGLILAAAGLVYLAPILILVCLPLGVLAASGAISQSSGLHQLSQTLGAVGAVALACVTVVVALYSLVLSIIRPLIMVIFSHDGTFASCFRFREITHILDLRTGPFLATWLAAILASLVIGLIVGSLNLVLGWIPCLGLIVGVILALGTAVYLMTVDAHLFGQFRVTALEPDR